MGGKRKSVEPLNYEEFKKDKTIWHILDCGGLTPFIERFHGADASIIKKFVKGLKDGKIQISGRNIEIDEKLIVEVISLSMDKEIFYRDRKCWMLQSKDFPEMRRNGRNWQKWIRATMIWVK